VITVRDILLKGLFGAFIIVGIVVAGCTTVSPEPVIPSHSLNFSQDTSSVQKPILLIPNKIPFSPIPDVSIEPIPGMVVNISGSNKSLQIEPRDGTPIVSPPTSEKPLFTTFHVGQSANDGNTRITLNSVKYNKSFHLEPYQHQGEFSSQRPGFQLMALNITIRDLGAQSEDDESLFNGVVVKDSEGRRYTPGLSIISNREEMSPGRTGNLFYEVPQNVPGITLNYHFPDEIGIIAKFDLAV